MKKIGTDYFDIYLSPILSWAFLIFQGFYISDLSVIFGTDFRKRNFEKENYVYSQKNIRNIGISSFKSVL